jgi:quinoprotein relay system zinc metallohydrolase 2
MFEAIAILCLTGSGEICREVLVPGFENADLEACQSGLPEARPEWITDGVVLDSLVCEAARPTPLSFAEVAPGLFVHRGAIAEPDPDNAGDVANIAFLVGTERVVVVDAGGSRKVGEGVWRAVRQQTDLPISHLVLTHMHPDHVFGASVFSEAGALVVGHANLPRALADRTADYLDNFADLVGPESFLGTYVPPIDLALDTPFAIDLGGRTIDLVPWPLAHTATDLTVTDAENGVLLAGDLLFDQHAPALDGSLRGWQAVLDLLEETGADRVVPGHGGPILPWPEGGAPLRAYLSLLESDTRAALNAGTGLAEAAETIATEASGDWQLFELFNPRNATVAYTELEWE